MTRSTTINPDLHELLADLTNVEHQHCSVYFDLHAPTGMFRHIAIRHHDPEPTSHALQITYFRHMEEANVWLHANGFPKLLLNARPTRLGRESE